MESHIFLIPEENLGKLHIAVERINKRAKKLGMPLVQIEKGAGQRTLVNRLDADGREFEVDTYVYRVAVTGEKPQLNGWRFLAKLDHMPDTDDVIILGDVPTQYQKCPPNCDHCNVKRERTTTFVLQNIESEEFKQVGSTCLKDFFNGDDPMNHAWALQALANLREEMSDFETLGASTAASYYDIDVILEKACAFARADGYISAQQAEEARILSTAACVKASMFDRKLQPTILPEDTQKAKAIVEWLSRDETRASASSSNYMNNLCTFASAGIVKPAHVGILASAVCSYDRMKEREALNASAKPSEYVGTVDERFDNLPVTVLGRKLIPGDRFGDKMLYIMRDDDGNRLSWFSTGKGIAAVGDKVHISGTVAKHEIYRDAKQTIVQRVVTNEDKLYDAIDAKKDTKVIAKLLQEPISINHRNVSGRYNVTALAMACIRGHAQATEMLLAQGADPEIMDEQRNRAAHYAASHGHLACLRVLNEWGADLTVAEKYGLTVEQLIEDAQKHLYFPARNQLEYDGRADLLSTPSSHWASEPTFPLSKLGNKKEWEKVLEAKRLVMEAEGRQFYVPNHPAVVLVDGDNYTVVAGQLQVAKAFADKKTHIECIVLHDKPVLELLQEREPVAEVESTTTIKVATRRPR